MGCKVIHKWAWIVNVSANPIVYSSVITTKMHVKLILTQLVNEKANLSNDVNFDLGASMFIRLKQMVVFICKIVPKAHQNVNSSVNRNFCGHSDAQGSG